MAWFEDRGIVEQLPVLFRLHAAYCRLMAGSGTGAARGSSALHRVIATVTRYLRLADVAAVQINGVTIVVDLLDLRLAEVFHECSHRSRDLEIVSALLSTGDTFLDIGANHGTFAVQAAPMVGASGSVLALEPQPRLAGLIEASFKANQFSQAVVRQVACGASEADVSFFIPRGDSGMASTFADLVSGHAANEVTVPQRRLDDLMRTERVTGSVVIKMDVEGAEVGALRGGVEFLRTHRPPLLLEINPESLRSAGHDIADLVEALAAAGYAWVADTDRWPETQPLASLAPAPQRNVLVTHG